MSGDGFDFDELARITECGDPEQGARGVVVAERGTDDVPGRDQVGPVIGGHVNRRLEDPGEPGPRCGQRLDEVGDALLCLGRDVPQPYDVSVGIERARTRGENELGGTTDGGVGVRDARVEPRRTNQSHRHRLTVSAAPWPPQRNSRPEPRDSVCVTMSLRSVHATVRYRHCLDFGGQPPVPVKSVYTINNGVITWIQSHSGTDTSE